jgi:hypothetical protein
MMSTAKNVPLAVYYVTAPNQEEAEKIIGVALEGKAYRLLQYREGCEVNL